MFQGDRLIHARRERVVGLAVLSAGLLSNPWLLGALFAPDGSIDGEARVRLILLVNVFLALSGIALVWTWPRRALRTFIPNRLAAAGFVAALSLLLVGGWWGITAYRGAHHHTAATADMPPPTAAERQWAETFVERCRRAARARGWFDFEKARADGFEQQWDDRAHYFNREFLFDDQLLDPERPEFLMYRDTPRGKLLIGFMFYTRSVAEVGPRPGGSLASWHFHPWGGRGYCAEKGLLVVSRPDEHGGCARGEFVNRSAEMLHVWFVDHPLGSYADAMVFPADSSTWDVTMLHPIAVHFSVALLIIAVLLDLVGRLARKPALHSAAFINLSFAAIFAVVTVAAGMAAEVRLLISHAVHEVLDTHKLLGFATCAAIIGMSAWRLALRGAFPIKAGMLYLVLAVGTASLATAASFFGAELVYGHGVGVKAIDRFALERLERTVFGDSGDEDMSTHGH
jgi:uncharacterized membrane protein